MGVTKIEWTDAVWQPVTGCTPVSEGCRNCYARRMAMRLRGRYGYPEADPFAVTTHPDRLDEPFHWRKPRAVFVCSMGDLFHKDVPGEFISDVLSIIERNQQHTFIILTKRPGRFFVLYNKATRYFCGGGDYLPNVILGVSVENQKTADERIPILLKTPAAKRIVSYEPALEPVDFMAYLPLARSDIRGLVYNPRGGPFLDGVIMGGESGPGARPMHPAWARSVRDQCEAAEVPFFFKQWGLGVGRGLGNHGDIYRELKDAGFDEYKKKGGRLLDGRTHDDLCWHTGGEDAAQKHT